MPAGQIGAISRMRWIPERDVGGSTGARGFIRMGPVPSQAVHDDHRSRRHRDPDDIVAFTDAESNNVVFTLKSFMNSLPGGPATREIAVRPRPGSPAWGKCCFTASAIFRERARIQHHDTLPATRIDGLYFLLLHADALGDLGPRRRTFDARIASDMIHDGDGSLCLIRAQVRRRARRRSCIGPAGIAHHQPFVSQHPPAYRESHR